MDREVNAFPATFAGVRTTSNESCPKQYCQSCGKQGHHRRDCQTERQVMCSENYEIPNVGRRPDPSGAVVEVTLDGHSKFALLDSGANPSLVDLETLQRMGVGYTEDTGRVYGVSTSPVPTVEMTEMVVDVGSGRDIISYLSDS